jgi:peptidoglycan/xylan/chitin deacetylase (PgdA/CDA1 family)
MKAIFTNALLSLFALSITTSTHAENAAEKFTWPHGTKAAVSLSYDDALDSQLDNAIPSLNKYNLKGSFYLTLSNETPLRRLEDWRAAARRGHELGNHTLFHQCSRSQPGHEWVKEQNNIDNISVAQMTQEILLANSFLHAIDGKTERTFTVPCGDVQAAGENYLPAIKPYFVAIKFTVGGVVDDMNSLDPYSVTVVTPSNVNGKLLIALVQAAAQKGTMVNILFHGIGGDYITTSKEAHDELLKYLYDNKDIYWTDTFIDIMKYVKNHQKK